MSLEKLDEIIEQRTKSLTQPGALVMCEPLQVCVFMPSEITQEQAYSFAKWWWKEVEQEVAAVKRREETAKLYRADLTVRKATAEETALKKMFIAIMRNDDVFKRLDLDANELITLESSEAFDRVVKAIAKLPSVYEKTTAAIDVFGKNWASCNFNFNQGSE